MKTRLAQMVGIVSEEGWHRQDHGPLKAMHLSLLSVQVPVHMGRGQRGAWDVLVYHCPSYFFETDSNQTWSWAGSQQPSEVLTLGL